MTGIALSVAFIALGVLAWDAWRRWLIAREVDTQTLVVEVKRIAPELERLRLEVKNLGNKVAIAGGRR